MCHSRYPRGVLPTENQRQQGGRNSCGGNDDEYHQDYRGPPLGQPGLHHVADGWVHGRVVQQECSRKRRLVGVSSIPAAPSTSVANSVVGCPALGHPTSPRPAFAFLSLIHI